VDQTGKDAAHSLNSEGKRSNIKEKDILDVTGKYSSLNGGTNSDGLIRVDSTVRCFAEEVLDNFSDLGDSSGSTHHEYFVDLVFGEVRILEAVL